MKKTPVKGLSDRYRWFHKETVDRETGFWPYMALMGVCPPWLEDEKDCMWEPKFSDIPIMSPRDMEGEEWKTFSSVPPKETDYSWLGLRYDIGIVYTFRRSNEVSLENIGIAPAVEIYDQDKLLQVSFINSIALRGNGMIEGPLNVIEFLFNKSKKDIVDSIMGIPPLDERYERAWTLTKKVDTIGLELNQALRFENYDLAVKLRDELALLGKMDGVIKSGLQN